MNLRESRLSGYALAALLGAVGGAFAVLFVTRAMRRLMSGMMNRMMSGMMENMMQHMGADGIDPEEMCRRMMAQFAGTQQETALTE